MIQLQSNYKTFSADKLVKFNQSNTQNNIAIDTETLTVIQ